MYSHNHSHYTGQDVHEHLYILMQKCSHLFQHHKMGKQEQGGRYTVLHRLLEKDGVTQQDLLRHMDIRSASMSETLKKMEDAGWISRTTSETDRRAATITLTDEGREKAKESIGARQQAAQEAFAVLSPEEKDQLCALLGKLLGQWKADAQAQDPKRSRPHDEHGEKHGRRPEERSR